MLSKTFQLADRYVDRFITLHPVAAVADGMTTAVDDLTDWSPAGFSARAALDRESVAVLAASSPTDASDVRARNYMSGRLRASVALYDAGELIELLRGDWGAAQLTRQVFDCLPRVTRDDWARVGTLLDRVPWALSGLEETLSQGVRDGRVASRRQALACAGDADRWSGVQDEDFFGDLIERSPIDLHRSAAAAAAAYGELGRYLRDSYAHKARSADACGRESYRRCVNAELGGDVDLAETYQWGWDEFHRLVTDRQRVCDRIEPGASFAHTVRLILGRPGGWIRGKDTYLQWLQDLQDRTAEELHGRYFDIPEAVRHVEVVLASEGSSPWYTPPPEDLSSPGRINYPIAAHRNNFRPIQALTTAYHEGIPGHHLQNGAVRVSAASLSRFQTMFPLSFHGEGWAHYAEGLMSELGYMDEPEAALGHLSGQIGRAMRVILDIGLHLELKIPEGEAFHPGETWSHDLAVEFLATDLSASQAANEVRRYLAMPGQAITYALGRRAWERSRAAVAADRGQLFELRHFHSEALRLGPLGIGALEQEITAACTMEASQERS